MRTTRVLVCCLVMGLLSVSIFGAVNQQKIYSLDSDVYDALEVLYIHQGLSLPSTTGPYSQAELSLMVEKIKASALQGSMKQTYEYVQGVLGVEPKTQGKGIGLSWGFDATLETYTHSDTTDFIGRDSWNYDSINHKPLLTVSLETWPAESFYGYSELSVGNTHTLENGFGTTTFATNIPMIPPSLMPDLDFNIPYRAFVAAGGEHWSLQAGRDRLSWGAGHTGNLMLSDSFKYHNMARVTTFSDKFKYTFVTSFFPHPLHYYDNVQSGVGYYKNPETGDIEEVSVYYNTQNDGPTEGDGQATALNGIYMFMSHRLEWRMFQDKVGLTLTESIMYQSKENYLDIRILNPAMIFHDYYIRSNANSILGLEIDYTPVNGLNIYAQAAVDEFSLPGEDVPSETETNFPITFGYLAGIKGVVPVADAVGYGSLEFAYTDPYLYLRYSETSSPDDSSSGYDDYGLNYVGAIREFTNKSGMRYNSEFIGYTYGNDALVVNLNGGVKSYGKWNLSGNVFYMAHGTFDMFTYWTRVGGGVADIPTTPTSGGSVGNYADSSYASRNAVEHTLVAGLYGSYQITDTLKTFGQLDYITIQNYQNIAGQKASDIQLTLGLSYTI
ncbi:hypothetical protein [Sphaerochaeta sp. S2]|uniref:hypothetical protein n=1 Tax=Sphaerochaeta sp. S2 TaxID=2798868 RepID=UPI0018E9E93E|nr:hypothetical protein [Sphaerochaeta sp. S2]MBJ2356423.1 hypothetical protein [Sphaerochaeta sp. S2]